MSGLASFEGVADLLAVASRLPCTVAGVMGTSGLKSPLTADALLDAFLVEIWEDKDGNGAAAVLREALAGRGVPVTARTVTHGKDPAAAGGPFPVVDGALLDVEAARGAADGLPLAEARRQAAALLMEAAALDSADAGGAA